MYSYTVVSVLVSILQCKCDVFTCFHPAGDIKFIACPPLCGTALILSNFVAATRLQQRFARRKMCHIYPRNHSLEAELQISSCKGHVCVLLRVQGRRFVPEH